MSYGDSGDGSKPGSLGPQLVNYPVTHTTFDYLRRLLALGALEGPIGKMQVSDAMRPILDAMHTVLAGGEVEITTKRRGHPDIYGELQARVAQAGQDANEINDKSGYYVTLT